MGHALWLSVTLLAIKPRDRPG